MLQRRKRDHFGCSLQRVLQGMYQQFLHSKVKEFVFNLATFISLWATHFTFFSILVISFQIIRYQGHLLAKELVARGLQTTLITDSAVFAMISRVNMVYYPSQLSLYLVLLDFLVCHLFSENFILKVIVGAHAVMANGGVIAPVGLNMVALAAQKHAVPFVVLAGSHKVIWSTVLAQNFYWKYTS